MSQQAVLRATETGQAFPVTGETTRIGRHQDNDIALDDTAVSRRHAEIVQRGGRFYVRDLGSTHGTLVNGARNDAETPLNDGDVVRFGDTELVFECREDDATPAESESTAVPLEDIIFRAASPRIPGLGNHTMTLSLPALQGVAPRQVLPSKHVDRIAAIAEAIQSIFDTDELLSKLMDMVFEVFAPERGAVLLRKSDAGEFLPRIERPAHAAEAISQTVIRYAVDNQMSLLISDLQADGRFSAADSIVMQSILSAICAPLVRKDRVLGVLYIDTRSQRIHYREEDLSLLNIIAANAAIAVENALLVQEKVEAERLAAMGVAIAGISHYAKNVIFGIKGSASLVERALEKDDLEGIRKIFPVMKRSNDKISALVQDMLTYSKKREPEWKEGDYNQLLEEVYEDQLARATDAHVALRLELDGAAPRAQFDAKALHDTVLNIVGNAIEACAERKEAKEDAEASVSLSSKHLAKDGRISITIADTGPGIPPAIQEKIFQPFFSTKGSRGTGLGLALARKTVEEHGGELRLRSEMGKGTTFEIVIPYR